MKKIKSKILKIISLTLVIIYSPASFSAQTSGTMETSIVTGLEVNKVTDINFGSISADDSLSGSVTVNNDGTVSTSNVSHLGNQSTGEYTVTGSDGTYNAGISSLTQLTSGSDSMNVNLSIDGGTTNRTISGGSDTLKVIGVLTVPANQEPGTYTGTYNVTAGY